MDGRINIQAKSVGITVGENDTKKDGSGMNSYVGTLPVPLFVQVHTCRITCLPVKEEKG